MKRSLVDRLRERQSANGKHIAAGAADPGAFQGDAYEGTPRHEPKYQGDHTLEPDAPAWQPPPWPTLPDDALYGLAGEIVKTIEPSSEADPAALLIQTLIAFGSLIGRTAHFKAEEDTHYLNEFAVLIGRTAKGRKGSSWGRVRRVVEAADPDWASGRVLSGLSSGEGLIEAVRDALRDREGEVVAAAVEDKRLLAYEGEFASVLRQIDRQGNTLSVILRHAWDGCRLRTLTRNSPLSATGAHVSLIGHCTADELTRLLSTTEVANGFGNRILWCCVRRSKELPDGAPLDGQEVGRLQMRFADAVAFAKNVGTMGRDGDARALWHQVYGPLSEGKPGLAGSLLARAEAHVMRLACLYALLDLECLVAAAHLRAALAMWGYVEQSVRYVWGTSLGDPVADEILAGLRASPRGLTRTEVSALFGRHRTAERISRALATLADHGLVRRESVATGGRPADVWVAEKAKEAKQAN